MKDEKRRVLLASGQAAIDKAIESEISQEVVGIIDRREDLISTIQKTGATLVLVGEGLPGNGNLPDLLLEAAGANPHTRFIYLAGKVDAKDKKSMDPLKQLARAGIYDIFHNGGVKKSELMFSINQGRSEEEARYLLIEDASTKNKKKSNDKKDEALETEESSVIERNYIPESKGDLEATVISFSSIKPGSGKSFFSSNIATAIAQFSKIGKEKRKPRVAVIDGDLQNVSIGTLFGIDDGESHLMRCMKAIGGLLNSKGELVATPESIQDVNSLILKSMTPYSKVRNLEVLAGSQEEYEELIQIPGHYYVYLIEALRLHYDYVVIDSNSSLAHITTLPILKMSDLNFYILNLDFNNVRNNVRYQETLKKWDIFDKVKYVLNEDTTGSNGKVRAAFGVPELLSLGFELETRVPLLDKNLANNRIYNGTPLVLDTGSDTLIYREPLLKLANDIVELRKMQINKPVKE